jgi:hypothetical protein
MLRPACGLGERLAYSTVISMGLVPLVAIVIARAAGIGISLWVAIVSAVIVFGSGAILYAWKGSAAKPISGLLPRPGPVRDFRVMALVAAVMALALITTLRLHGMNLQVVTPSTPRLLIVLTAAGLVVAGIVVAWPRPGPSLPGTPAPPGGPGTPARTDEPDTPAASPAVATQPDSDTQPASGGPVTRAARVMSQAAVQPRAAATAAPRAWWAATGGPAWVREGALAVVLVLTGYRAYARVVNYEWPFIEGGDQYNHAVMAEQMLTHGSYSSYLVYPPGFSALTAVLSRFADLSSVKIFPVLAPALVVLCSLGAYAVAARLWDWRYGIVATAVNGLVLTSAYNGLTDGRYPDLVSAYFLLVMTVAALLLFYEVPSFRSGVIVTIAGSSVVLYHTVATLYLVILLAAVAVIGLPYLAVTGQRRLARGLLLALGAVTVVSAGYAAYIYNLPQILSGHASSTATVSQDLGSQAVPSLWHVLAEVSPPVAWLGLFGAVLLLVGLRHVRRPEQVLGAATMVVWCGLMYLGSRTAVDGFPVRFERDVGAPLSITAALGVGVCVHTIVAYFNARTRRQVMIEVGAYAAVALAAVMALVQVVGNIDTTGRPRTQIINRPLANAGAWLSRHNTGGTIISTPSLPGGSRTMLGLGGYTELQSFSAYRTANPRSLPTAGLQQLLDSRYVLLHPTECRSAQIMARNDVRYVVLLTNGSGSHLAGFAAEPQRYRPVYQNVSVVIYQPLRTSCFR